ncbi:MAG: hypothetical protein NTY22_00650 [Proteobacteria bacterium]|nr:hypothetical protein [Pseudomonadota bacterium]
MKSSLILAAIISCLLITSCKKYEEIDISSQQMKNMTEDNTNYRVINNILGTNKGVVIVYDTIGMGHAGDSVFLKQGPVNGNYKLIKIALKQIAQYKNSIIGLGTDGVLYVATVQQDGAETIVYTKISLNSPATIISFSVNGNTIEATDTYNNKHTYTGSSDSLVSIKAACAECSYMFGITLGSVAVEIDKSDPKGKEIKLTEMRK